MPCLGTLLPLLPLLPLLLPTTLASLPQWQGNILGHHTLLDTPSLLPSQLKSSDEPGLDLGLLMSYLTPLGPGVSAVCNQSSSLYIRRIMEGNGQALKMMDASAKVPPPGMLTDFIVHHPGSFDSCLEVQLDEFAGQHCLLTSFADGWAWEAFSEVEGRDRREKRDQHRAALTFNSLRVPFRKPRGGEDPEEPTDTMAYFLGMGIIRLGRCVPSTCTPEDVAQGLTNFLAEAGQDLTGYHISTLNCHTAEEEIPLDNGDWVMIGIIAFFCSLVLAGTTLDVLINLLNLDIFPDFVVQVVQGFSLYTNTTKLFHCPEPGTTPGSLDCINGIRFLSMTWVVIGHAYSNFVQGGIFVNNLMVQTDWSQDGAFAVVINAFPSVDSFFLIGACLLSYITLKELDKTNGGGVKFWIMYYVHRYIRLTGLYAILIGLHATLLKFFATGVQSNGVTFNVDACRDTWWTNLLYVNNLKWVGDMVMGCMGVTWYMANDMQFFLVSPIIIFALWKGRVPGLSLLGILLAIFTAIPIALGIVNDYPFTESIMGGGNTDIIAYMEDFYVVPWCRYQPYLVGLGLGYLLHQLRNQPRLPIAFNPIVVTWLWLISAAMACLVIYGLVPYQKDVELEASTIVRALYGGLHRLAWSFSLSWVILACVKGCGGPVNSILAWPAWVPLARMSYCIYLVHMTVIPVVSSYDSFRVTISHVLVSYYIVFVVCVSIAVSYVLIVLFEAPLVHLEKLLYWSLGVGKPPAVRRIKTE